MIGTDIEYPVYKGDVLDAACGLIGGSKAAPLWVPGGNLQEDNIMAEMATHPSRTEQEFINNICDLKEELQRVLQAQGCTIHNEVTVAPSQELLDDCGSAAKQFGCSREVDAYTGKWLPVPEDVTGIRTAGGHVHYSYPQPNDTKSLEISQLMDYVLGTWSVLSCPDKARRVLYGRAGSMRLKEYGGEYRVLSNSWTYEDKSIRYVYKCTEWCINNTDKLAVLKAMYPEQEVQRCINEYDRGYATGVQKTIAKMMEVV